MFSTALTENGWIEEEAFLSEHWDEMTISDPAVAFAGIWMDNHYICLYSDRLVTLPDRIRTEHH